jgi:protein involved in polysaccharide export with SLBB domain
MRHGQTVLTFRITGEVRDAGTYVWWPSLTLKASVEIAGGLTPHGTLRGARAQRGWRVVRLAPMDRIEADDRIMISRRLF